jgi:hypothetical protein
MSSRAPGTAFASRVPMTRTTVLSLLIAILLPFGARVWAGLPVPDCEAHAEAAGREAGIPDGILPAIARVESGRNGHAWPWTLNQGGDGSFHPTKEAALQKLAEILGSGVQNVDLGCMQVNWRWHSGAFADASAMMDPVENTRYAARYLNDLRDQLGSWESAVAAYHSREPVRGAAYGEEVARVRERFLAQLAGEAPVMEWADSASRSGQMVASVTRGLLALSGQPVVRRRDTTGTDSTRLAGGLFPVRGEALLSADN